MPVSTMLTRAFAVGASTAVLAACGADGEEKAATGVAPGASTAPVSTSGDQVVCEGTPEHIVVVAMRSYSDLDLAREYAPKVVEEARDRAISSCGTLTVGLAGEKPSQTVLHTLRMVPSKREAFRARPIRNRMRKEADPQIAEHLLDPVKRATAGVESPFLTLAAFVRDELRKHDVTPTMVVLIGDAVVVERDAGIDALSHRMPKDALDAFVPRLRGLPCTAIIGAAIDSGLREEVLQDTLGALERTFAEAGVKLIATPSEQLPSCSASTTAAR